METINLDRSTYDAIDLAARLTGLSHSQVVARLVQQSRISNAPDPIGHSDDAGRTLGIFVDYEGRRTNARFDQLTNRIDIEDGPLAGRSFKSPSSAARAVVAHYKPHVSPHRNGWSFWILADGSGELLQSVRTMKE
jgi:hypothetical protein